MGNLGQANFLLETQLVHLIRGLSRAILYAIVSISGNVYKGLKNLAGPQLLFLGIETCTQDHEMIWLQSLSLYLKNDSSGLGMASRAPWSEADVTESEAHDAGDHSFL